MIESIHPGFILIVGAFLIPFLPGVVKKAYMLILPAVAFAVVLNMSPGTYWVFNYMGNDLIFGQVDKLSLVFGYVFTMMVFIGLLYSLHVDDNRQHVAALLYAGSSLGVVFAGDYFTIFIFWEVMAFASAYLIFAGGNDGSEQAGFRYILVHVAGGVCLLAGIIIHYVSSGSLLFGPVDRGTIAFYLIMIGFITNAAVPPLSAWLSDAYPEASITGSVFLCAFTTKTAVYVLIRAFPGTEILVWMGAIMTLYGAIYATMENDCRRLLSYHIISQVGYMVAGVGLGTELALNGATSHAFTHILYKALLFMGAGSVVYMTGVRKLTEMGGLYKRMPVTMVLYLIGGFSISAFPLFSGFVSKSMIVSASAHDHRAVITLMLIMAASGTFLSTTLKLGYYMFFGKDSGLKAKEPPLNMILGMCVAAFLCIAIGVYPDTLYSLLPFDVDYHPYTGNHITESLGILLFTGLAFFILLKKAAPHHTVSLDTDWFYRRGARAFMFFVRNTVCGFYDEMASLVFKHIPTFLIWFGKNPLAAIMIAFDKARLGFVNPAGRPAIEQRMNKEKSIYPGDIIKHWPIGATVLWAGLLLLAYLLIYYL